jgi:hypothetical protein
LTRNRKASGGSADFPAIRCGRENLAGAAAADTSWAESVNALRLQTGQAPSMEAYFRMAHNSGYHLLRHMTASTPSL